VCVCVPIVLGAGGMERIIETPLNEQEKAAFAASVAAVRR
jgi:malate/lactate dehydrogenase